jgi:hypothetical protein
MNLLGRGAAVAALLVGSAALAQGQEQWTTYESPGSGFHVELPAKPTVPSGDVNSSYGPVHKVQVTLKLGGSLDCTATQSDYQPAAISTDPQGTLSRSRQNYADKFPVRAEERFTLGTAPAMRLLMDLPDNRVARYEEILVRDRALLLICIVPKGQENSRDIARIYKSFVAKGQ